MTLTDILEQAKTLSVYERRELAKLLIDSLVEGEDVGIPSSETMPSEAHWGQSLNRLMDEIGPIEMKYPEIEDPVEWVKRLRADERRRRLGEWGDDA